MSYTEIGSGGGGGSAFFIDPVANFASLPTGVPSGTLGLTTDTGVVYWFDGSVWDAIDTELASVAATDTNSIDLTVTGGVLSADSKLSAAAAPAGFFKATNSIQTDGLRTVIEEASGSQTGVLKSADWTTFNSKVSTSRTINTTSPITGGGDLSADRTIAIPQATGSVDGFLDSADWTTFSNKEPAISSGSTSQFWRGDKSFQTLDMAALTVRVDGNIPVSGIGQVIQAQQGSFTDTGVGSSDSYGSVISVSVPAGIWMLHGTVAIEENGAVLVNNFMAGISDSATGSGIGSFDTIRTPFIVASSGEVIQLSVPQKLISVSTTTTYYLNSKFVYTSGSPRHKGEIWGVRIG